MATQTLKIGSGATVKETGFTGVILDVCNGRYKIKGLAGKFQAAELRAVKTKPAPKKKGKIEYASGDRKKLNAIYSILAKEIKSTTAVCEGHGKIEGCNGLATEIHHKKGRRGFLLIMSKFFSRQCSHCHRYITVHSQEARDKGLSMLINSMSEPCFTEKEAALISQFGIKFPKNYKIC